MFIYVVHGEETYLRVCIYLVVCVCVCEIINPGYIYYILFDVSTKVHLFGLDGCWDAFSRLMDAPVSLVREWRVRSLWRTELRRLERRECELRPWKSKDSSVLGYHLYYCLLLLFIKTYYLFDILN